MANPYTSPTLANYNANPPSDDGAQTEDNRITWNIHVRGKIGDPLRNFAESITTNVLSAFDSIMFNGVSARAASFTVATADQGSVFVCTNSITVTLPSAASVGSNFAIAVQKADGTPNVVTIDPDASETVDGAATITLTRNLESVILVSTGSNWNSIGRVPTGLVVLNNHFTGFTMSNSSGDLDHDIEVQPGQCSNSTNEILINLLTAITKRIDASFTEGSAGGGLDTGTVAASTTYHLHVIAKDDGTTDVLFSTSATAPTLPTDYNVFRRIGMVETDTNSNIINGRFSQVNENGEEAVGQITIDSGTFSTLLFMPDNPKNIIMRADGLSTDSANASILFRIGTNAGMSATNYTGSVTGQQGGTTEDSQPTTSFSLTSPTLFDAAQIYDGVITLAHVGSNIWSFQSVGVGHATGQFFNGIGTQPLPGVLDRLQFLLLGGPQFDGTGNATAYFRITTY